MILAKSTPDSEEKTAVVLRSGGVAVIPTDTIYGFSGIVPETEAAIRRIKGRAEQKSFIRLIAEPRDIFKYTRSRISPEVFGLWPGPLTLIVSLVEGGTAAFRCPGDDWLRRVIRAAGKPIFSTSVNHAGQPPLHKISGIIREFENETALIVDAGDYPDSPPSTILDISGGGFKVIRQGSLKVTT
jgi:L-threonylcarbamoyladenylate synthase